jgi:transcriptional regulator with XRE-family HTH domain
MTPLQLRLARTALSLTVREAAELAQVSHETIVGIEAARPSIKEKTIEKVRAALEKAGIDSLTKTAAARASGCGTPGGRGSKTGFLLPKVTPSRRWAVDLFILA